MVLTGFVEAWQVGNARSNLSHDSLYLSHDFLVTLFPRHTETRKKKKMKTMRSYPQLEHFSNFILRSILCEGKKKLKPNIWFITPSQRPRYQSQW